MSPHHLEPCRSSPRRVLWDPSDVLGLCSDGRCVGRALSKRRKCMNIIAESSVYDAKDLLDEISTRQPNTESRTLIRNLERLAVHGLCVRSHQNQADQVVSTWVRCIKDAYPHGRVSRLRAATATLGEEITTVATPSSRRRDRPSTSEFQDRLRALERRMDEMEGPFLAYIEEMLSDIERKFNELEELSLSSTADLQNSVDMVEQRSNRTSPPRSGSSRASNASGSETVEGRSGRRTGTPRRDTASDNGLETGRQSRTAATPAAESSSQDTAEGGRAPSATQPAPRVSRNSATRTACRSNHVPRRSLNERCGICLLDEDMSTRPLGELVWCKGQCGRSVHVDCFVPWRAQCVNNNRRVTCTQCRTNWVDCEEDCQYEWRAEPSDGSREIPAEILDDDE